MRWVCGTRWTQMEIDDAFFVRDAEMEEGDKAARVAGFEDRDEDRAAE